MSDHSISISRLQADDSCKNIGHRSRVDQDSLITKQSFHRLTLRVATLHPKLRTCGPTLVWSALIDRNRLSEAETCNKPGRRGSGGAFTHCTIVNKCETGLEVMKVHSFFEFQ
jgi:hypothetical protein